VTLPPPPPRRIPNVSATLRASACDGDLRALDEILRTLEPGVFALAARMLGNQQDAEEATQDVLVRVATHLGSFRGDAAFSTWVYRIARNVLLTYRTRTAEWPETSVEALHEKLAAGRAYGAATGAALESRSLSAADKAEAADVARRCTQHFVMTLDREHRLAWILNVVFGLSGEEAAEVLEITPAAYRKRLSRARARLDGALQQECGLVSAEAPCRCEAQLPAVRATRASGQRETTTLPVLEHVPTYDDLAGLFDVVTLYREQSRYAANGTLPQAIRAALAARGWMGHG
jgi:RNA polymerase sigma factor (sigma-70 family)